MKSNSDFPLMPHLHCPERPITTGSWRLVRPEFDPQKCNLCLICWSYCPDGVIKRTNGKLTVDLEYCKGCGICSNECPRRAITMVEEN